MKREIELEIAGQRLHIRTDEDESYMRGLAAFVDEQMREIGRGQQRGIASITIALLAALRIADDLSKARAASEDYESSLGRLADMVEAALEVRETVDR